MDDNRLPKQAYKMLLCMNNNGNQNWVTKLKDLLYKTGFGHVWLDGVSNQGLFFREFRQRLIDMNAQEWHGALCASDRFALYSKFKTDLYAENYLDEIRQKGFRDVLIRIRLGISNLKAHKNRYIINQHVNNQCSVCPDSKDDELHVMFSCPAYADIRPLFFT